MEMLEIYGKKTFKHRFDEKQTQCWQGFFAVAYFYVIYPSEQREKGKAKGSQMFNKLNLSITTRFDQLIPALLCCSGVALGLDDLPKCETSFRDHGVQQAPDQIAFWSIWLYSIF